MEKIILPGLTNFYRVSENLYRGAQPTRKGFKSLRAIGVKTIVNLRSFHSDHLPAAGLGFYLKHIWMKAWHPEEEDVFKFLKIMEMAEIRHETPAFVHCQPGSDKTGTMCAVYRFKIMGWTKGQAIAEMVKGPFGFHQIWGGLLPQFIVNL